MQLPMLHAVRILQARHFIQNQRFISHPAPAQYDATVLCSKKKRGRPKKVSAAWNIDDTAPIILLDDSDDDEPSADVAYCVAV